MTNQPGGTSYEQVHLPFGNESDAESTGAAGRRFTSYERRARTGLDYAQNRTYDPERGRFTQVDPIAMGSVTRVGNKLFGFAVKREHRRQRRMSFQF